MDELAQQIKAAAEAKPGGQVQKLEAEKVSQTVGHAIGAMVEELAKNNPHVSIDIHIDPERSR